MTSRRITIALAIGLVLAAGAAGAGTRRSEGHRELPAGRTLGPAKNCIRLVEITNSRVRDDWTIDFEVGSPRRVYRNVLDHRCPGLNAANAFSYNASLSQLCSTDLVHPLHQSGGLSHGPGCGLGKFVPMELNRR